MEEHNFWYGTRHVQVVRRDNTLDLLVNGDLVVSYHESIGRLGYYVGRSVNRFIHEINWFLNEYATGLEVLEYSEWEYWVYHPWCKKYDLVKRPDAVGFL